jgi:dUTP pyrophosphatase
MKNPYLEVPIQIETEDNIPLYATEDSAGADVRAHLQHEIVLPPGQSALIPTGIRAAIPSGYELQIRPRSGLALKEQITILNTPGTIDADYRGEIGVILINHGKKEFIVKPGMRIAQFILAPVIHAHFTPVVQLAETVRGAGGFGHTGTH